MSRSEPGRIEARSGESTDLPATTPRPWSGEPRPSEAAFVCDTKLRVKSWSAEAERMFGWTAREASRRPASEVLSTETVGREIGDAMASLCEVGRLRAVAWQTCRDGTRVEVLTTWSTLCGSDGRRTGFLCTCRDETTEEKAWWHAMLLKQIPGVLWMTDTDLRATVSGGAGMTQMGFPPGEWVGKTIYEYFGTDDPNFPAIVAHRSALAGKSVDFDYEWMGRSVHSRVEPLRDAAGTIVGVVGNAEDVTATREAERSLRERSELLRLVLENIPSGVLVVDADATPCVFNRSAEHILRGKPGSITLDESAQLLGVYRSDRETPYSVAELPSARALRGEAVDEPEMFVCNEQIPDGIWLSSSARPLLDETGTVRGAVSVFQEITERKQTAQRLAEQTRLFELVLENMPVGAIVLDEAGHAVIFNRVAQRLLGERPKTFSVDTWSESFGVYLPDMVTLYPPEQLPTTRALRGEEVDEPEIFLRGAAFPGGIWINSRVRPLTDEKGDIRGAVVLFQDITERKQAEQKVRALNEELEGRVRERTAELESAKESLEHEVRRRAAKERELSRSEAALSAVVESSTEAIWSVDRQYRFVTFNAVIEAELKAAFGRGPTVGSASNEGMSDRVRRHWQALYDRSLAGERFTLERTYEIGGIVRHFLVSMNPIVDRGEISGVTVFGKDISELKRAEEQARRREQELAHLLRVRTIGELTAGLAHEINQPLGAIASYAQGCRRRLESGQAEPHEILPVVESIAAEALRAGEVIRRLRNLIRRQEIRRERADLNRTVLEAVKVASPQAERYGIVIRWKPAQDSPTVHADIVQVQQVVLNLLINALDAMGAAEQTEREVVLETVTRHGEHVEVMVRDTGSGLPNAEADDIFKPFVGTKREGLGMGLAISHSIIEAHGGKIWATANQGPGTTFHFTLPIEE